MYETAIKYIGLTVIFCGTVTALFFIAGLAMDYWYLKYRDAVGFAKLSRCYRILCRIQDRKKNANK